jgi:hypothetical protein
VWQPRLTGGQEAAAVLYCTRRKVKSIKAVPATQSLLKDGGNAQGLLCLRVSIRFICVQHRSAAAQ